MARNASRISVVVVVGKLRNRARRTLRALLEQRGAPEMEIIAVDVSPFEEPLGVEGTHSTPFKWVPYGNARSIPYAKARGAQEAEAEIIAFLEDHCLPSPEWAARLMEAFERTNADGVAYEFHNQNPVNRVSRAFLTLAYGPWAAPVTEGPISLPSWMNVAYRRPALAPYLPELGQWFSCEWLMLQRLRAAGLRFWQSRAKVYHLNHPSWLGSARDSAVWQRLQAAARVERERWGWPRRLVYFLGSPLSPWLIVARLGRRLWKQPAKRAAFLRCLPLAVFVYSFGALNEAQGYLFGEGPAGRKSIGVETEDPRGEPG